MNNINEMIEYQLKDVEISKKLHYQDILRISKYLSNSIMTDECSIWNGSITIKNNIPYTDFYLSKKKHSVQKILYINFKLIYI